MGSMCMVRSRYGRIISRGSVWMESERVMDAGSCVVCVVASVASWRCFGEPNALSVYVCSPGRLKSRYKVSSFQSTFAT